MASAEADPVSLYLATEGQEANEFKRTSSRLIEMSSESYLALPHGHKDSAASGFQHRAGGDLTCAAPYADSRHSVAMRQHRTRSRREFPGLVLGASRNDESRLIEIKAGPTIEQAGLERFRRKG